MLKKHIKNEPLNPKLNPNLHSCNAPFFNHFFISKEYYENKYLDDFCTFSSF